MTRLAALRSEIADVQASGRLPLATDRSGVRNEVRRSPAAPGEAAFPLRNVQVASNATFRRAVIERFSESAGAAATDHLSTSDPENSARRLFTGPQQAVLIASVITAFAAFVSAPITSLVALNALATAYLIITILFRGYLAASVYGEPYSPTASASGEDGLQDEDLPIVTILLPLFREGDSLPTLARAIASFDYPKHKLDVKLILEESDTGTREEAIALGLDTEWEIVIAPPSQPQTKPKACNFALAFAEGGLTVIYDAEDEPAPDQLRKAAAVFEHADDDLVCVQARLNFYNPRENWLTRLFALEYALWFDSLMPALRRLGAPIPLGGTSNVFRTNKLRELGAWDPYNVTEDADLGLRIARKGYRTELIDSSTLEEANCRLGNWLRQRSRWMKGYIQTWIVDLRNPARGANGSLLRGLASSQLFIAGTVISALLNPILWGVFAVWLATRSPAIALAFPEPLLSLNLFALLFGNALFIFMAMIAPLKRGWSDLSPAAWFMPVYWWLMSFAAYMAVWQLIRRPHFWEKTNHALSVDARARRKEAVAALQAESDGR
ncbi:MAG: glycosyltransferase family 2 protein [Pseudomonadota bacterium]